MNTVPLLTEFHRKQDFPAHRPINSSTRYRFSIRHTKKSCPLTLLLPSSRQNVFPYIFQAILQNNL